MSQHSFSAAARHVGSVCPFIPYWRTFFAAGALLALLCLSTWCIEAADGESAASYGETKITARTGEFDLKSRQVVYRENVTVLDPRIQLTCELLTANIAESGGRVDSLIAESNVVAIIATNDTVYTVKSEKAIYTYQLVGATTNQTLELSGPPAPKITWVQPNSEPPRTNTGIASRILWDLISGKIKAENPQGVFPSVDAARNPLRDITEPTSTNSSPAAPTTPNP
jgi:lipopolysaccharide export system protein LptA